MDRLDVGAELVAVTDIRNDEIRRQMESGGRDAGKVAFFTDPDEMLDSAQLDGVIVATRPSLHAQMAIKILGRNLPLFLEKPVATNMADLAALHTAGMVSSSKVVVSYPLRVKHLALLAKQIIDSGQIGTVEHVQAWNNVIWGWSYYQGWYRDKSENPSLFLQKANNDFDYINYLVGVHPRWISATTSKRVFTGDRAAGLCCDDCEEQESCLESPFHGYFTKGKEPRVQPSGSRCLFAVDTPHEDSGSAIIEYETGMHVAYSQNFFARGSAGKRGASLLGYKGTIEFDWYTNELKVHMHHTPRTETHRLQTAGMTHRGGETVLADNFARVIRGECDSLAPLEAGIVSALMCMKAAESARTRTFQEIAFGAN